MTAVNILAKGATLQFCDLDISQGLKKGIEDLGYVTPTPFQNGVFEGFRSGRNIIGQGRSNYGKSLAFSMPIVAKIDPQAQSLQALIICDNQKLCDIMCKEFKALGQHLGISVSSAASVKPETSTQIFICTPDELPKFIDSWCTEKLETIFFDSLCKENTAIVIEKLSPILHKTGAQILIFGEAVLSAFQDNAQEYIKSATFVDNIDMPKIEEPTKHIYHLQNDDAPKPRALLAALELHQPKNALVVCEDAAECEFLSRYLARFGYKAKVASEEVNATGLAQGIKDLELGKPGIFIVQSTVLSDANLAGVPLMILYNMIEQPAQYERLTQFAKKSPQVERMIVSLLCSRDLSALGPIKAQCLIDFTEISLPSDDAVTELCAKRIAQGLQAEAREVELSQYEVLAKQILSFDGANSVLALLLKNHLAQAAKVEERRPPRTEEATREPKHYDRRSRPESREARGPAREERSRPQSESTRAPIEQTSDGISRIYITLGRQDGLEDLASLAQYLSTKSGIDLGHFSGSGMLRDTSAHIEVDDDVAETLIQALNGSERPGSDKCAPEGEKSLVVCERAKGQPQRTFRRPSHPRRNGPHPNRR